MVLNDGNTFAIDVFRSGNADQDAGPVLLYQQGQRHFCISVTLSSTTKQNYFVPLRRFFSGQLPTFQNDFARMWQFQFAAKKSSGSFSSWPSMENWLYQLRNFWQEDGGDPKLQDLLETGVGLIDSVLCLEKHGLVQLNLKITNIFCRKYVPPESSSISDTVSRRVERRFESSCLPMLAFYGSANVQAAFVDNKESRCPSKPPRKNRGLTTVRDRIFGKLTPQGPETPTATTWTMLGIPIDAQKSQGPQVSRSTHSDPKQDRRELILQQACSPARNTGDARNTINPPSKSLSPDQPKNDILLDPAAEKPDTTLVQSAAWQVGAIIVTILFYNVYDNNNIRGRPKISDIVNVNDLCQGRPAPDAIKTSLLRHIDALATHWNEKLDVVQAVEETVQQRNRWDSSTSVLEEVSHQTTTKRKTENIAALVKSITLYALNCDPAKRQLENLRKEMRQLRYDYVKFSFWNRVPRKLKCDLLAKQEDKKAERGTTVAANQHPQQDVVGGEREYDIKDEGTLRPLTPPGLGSSSSSRRIVRPSLGIISDTQLEIRVDTGLGQTQDKEVEQTPEYVRPTAAAEQLAETSAYSFTHGPSGSAEDQEPSKMSDIDNSEETETKPGDVEVRQQRITSHATPSVSTIALSSSSPTTSQRTATSSSKEDDDKDSQHAAAEDSVGRESSPQSRSASSQSTVQLTESSRLTQMSAERSKARFADVDKGKPTAVNDVRGSATTTSSTEKHDGSSSGSSDIKNGAAKPLSSRDVVLHLLGSDAESEDDGEKAGMESDAEQTPKETKLESRASQADRAHATTTRKVHVFVQNTGGADEARQKAGARPKDLGDDEREFVTSTLAMILHDDTTTETRGTWEASESADNADAPAGKRSHPLASALDLGSIKPQSPGPAPVEQVEKQGIEAGNSESESRRKKRIYADEHTSAKKIAAPAQAPEAAQLEQHQDGQEDILVEVRHQPTSDTDAGADDNVNDDVHRQTEQDASGPSTSSAFAHEDYGKAGASELDEDEIEAEVLAPSTKTRDTVTGKTKQADATSDVVAKTPSATAASRNDMNEDNTFETSAIDLVLETSGSVNHIRQVPASTLFSDVSETATEVISSSAGSTSTLAFGGSTPVTAPPSDGNHADDDELSRRMMGTDAHTSTSSDSEIKTQRTKDERDTSDSSRRSTSSASTSQEGALLRDNNKEDRKENDKGQVKEFQEHTKTQAEEEQHLQKQSLELEDEAHDNDKSPLGLVSGRGPGNTAIEKTQFVKEEKNHGQDDDEKFASTAALSVSVVDSKAAKGVPALGSSPNQEVEHKPLPPDQDSMVVESTDSPRRTANTPTLLEPSSSGRMDSRKASGGDKRIYGHQRADSTHEQGKPEHEFIQYSIKNSDVDHADDATSGKIHEKEEDVQRHRGESARNVNEGIIKTPAADASHPKKSLTTTSSLSTTPGFGIGAVGGNQYYGHRVALDSTNNGASGATRASSSTTVSPTKSQYEEFVAATTTIAPAAVGHDGSSTLSSSSATTSPIPQDLVSGVFASVSSWVRTFAGARRKKALRGKSEAAGARHQGRMLRSVEKNTKKRSNIKGVELAPDPGAPQDMLVLDHTNDKAEKSSARSADTMTAEHSSAVTTSAP
ncbi:unnamed protein product [Amoebophrya sp. A25]|nr:unnamed protein product [Amoebophrya sp. A25]|eukprot:GSA25T00006017001.1